MGYILYDGVGHGCRSVPGALDVKCNNQQSAAAKSKERKAELGISLSIECCLIKTASSILYV